MSHLFYSRPQLVVWLFVVVTTNKTPEPRQPTTTHKHHKGIRFDCVIKDIKTQLIKTTASAPCMNGRTGRPDNPSEKTHGTTQQENPNNLKLIFHNSIGFSVENK